MIVETMVWALKKTNGVEGEGEARSRAPGHGWAAFLRTDDALPSWPLGFSRLTPATLHGGCSWLTS